MDFDDSWFFMQGPDIVVQRILSGILIRSLFTWQIPAEWGWFMYIWCVNVLFYEIRHMQDSFSDWPHRPLWLTSLLKRAIINDQHLFLFNVSVSVCPSSSPSLPPLLNSCGFVSLCSGMLGWPQLCGWAVQTRRPHLSLCMHGAHPYLRTTVRQDSAA